MTPLKYLQLVLLLVLAFSCQKKNQNEDLSFIFDKDTGTLTLNGNYHKINKIEITDSSNLFVKQVITLDSLSTIERISSYKKFFEYDEYENSRICIDNQGNLDFINSYFYDAKVNYSIDGIEIFCSFQTSQFVNGTKYILVGNYDENYNTLNQVDTVYFEGNETVKFIDKNSQKGKNNVRFIIVEEEKKGENINRRMIFAEKKYYLQ